jgi:ribonuclease BN (tRNA processing enzyme)
VEVETGGQNIIFDAGTGIIRLGRQFLRSRNRSRTLNLFLSHTHHDHLLGFYFFEPLFQARCQVNVFGPGASRRSLADTLAAVMEPRFFPVGPSDFKAATKLYPLQGGERVLLRNPKMAPRVDRRANGASKLNVTIMAQKSLAHPNGVLLYRVWHRGKSVVYATDVEQGKDGDAAALEFFRGADLLIHDAQYLESEYSSRSSPRRGWGHTSIERAVRVARRAGVKELVLFHHDPAHDDRTLRRVERSASRFVPATRIAYEGLEIKL